MGKTKIYKGRFLPFKQARKKARTLGLRSRREWGQLCHSKDRPIDLPVLPYLTYKEHGWIDWVDFLGHKPIEKFLPFYKARKFVRSLGLKTKAEWLSYSSSGKRPKNIPSEPSKTYKKEYKGLRDWIGLQERKFLPFAEAREYVRKTIHSAKSDWWTWCKMYRHSTSHTIPTRPHLTYRDKGWKSWTDWFGTQEKKFLPYRKAKALARTLGVKSKKEWYILCKQKKRPKGMPAWPNVYYKEFISYPDFFGYPRRRKAKKK